MKKVIYFNPTSGQDESMTYLDIISQDEGKYCVRNPMSESDIIELTIEEPSKIVYVPEYFAGLRHIVSLIDTDERINIYDLYGTNMYSAQILAISKDNKVIHFRGKAQSSYLLNVLTQECGLPLKINKDLKKRISLDKELEYMYFTLEGERFKNLKCDKLILKKAKNARLKELEKINKQKDVLDRALGIIEAEEVKHLTQQEKIDMLHRESGRGLIECKKALAFANWNMGLARIRFTIRGPLHRCVLSHIEDTSSIYQKLSDESGWSLEDCTTLLNAVGLQYYSDTLDFIKNHPGGLNSVL